ncbi:hypothetical protein OTU49_007101, partial [Cherax quadricarinatus]
MPSAFDLFGPFENSLRTYHKPQWRLRPCPYGIHVPESCTCEPTHECKRPHCANDMPLDPLSRLTIGTPFGPMTSIVDSPSSHKCRSNGCSQSPPTTPTRAPSAFSVAVVDRLYSTPTHASAAKMKCVGRSQSHDAAGDDPPDDTVGGHVGRKAGSRLISQLISDQVLGSHDRTRRDGASPTRRTQGIRRVPTNFPSDLAYPTRRSQSSHAAVKTVNSHFSKRSRVSESDASSSELSSSPETSPGTTPVTTPVTTPLSTPRKLLSPQNNINQVFHMKTSTWKRVAKSPSARASAVFCGGITKGKMKPTPLNKSASDGIELLRTNAGLRQVKGIGVLGDGDKKILCEDLLREPVSGKVSRVSSDSRVDELLAQAYMALESLIPEHNNGASLVPCQPQHDSLRRLAIAHARKENGKSYKDLTQILQEKIEELEDSM